MNFANYVLYLIVINGAGISDCVFAEVIQECGVRFKCLDVYPYGRTVPLNIIRKHLPKLSAMTMRPHGSEFFWTGLQLDEFPLFDHLDTLLLDSINLRK